MSLRYFLIQTAPEANPIDAPTIENALRLSQTGTEIACRDITHVVDAFRIVHSQLERQVALLAQQLSIAAEISAEGDTCVCWECPAETDGCGVKCVEVLTKWAQQQAIEQG
jgi:hypothetical protein